MYILYRPWDETPCYVGKGCGDRWSEHQRLGIGHYNKNLGRIYAKAAHLGMKVVKKKLFRALSEAEALSLEIETIARYGRKPNGPLVNLTDGGEGISGLVMSNESREKLSKIQKNNWARPEQRASARAAMKAHWDDPDYKARQKARRIELGGGAKISAKLKQRWTDPEWRANQVAKRKGRSYGLGIPKSKSHKAILSELAKKRWADPEYRKMMTGPARSALIKKLWRNPEFRKKQLEARKKAKLHD